MVMLSAAGKIDRSVAGLGDAVFGEFNAGYFATNLSACEYEDAVADLGQLLGIGTGARDRHARGRGRAQRGLAS